MFKILAVAFLVASHQPVLKLQSNPFPTLAECEEHRAAEQPQIEHVLSERAGEDVKIASQCVEVGDPV